MPQQTGGFSELKPNFHGYPHALIHTRRSCRPHDRGLQLVDDNAREKEERAFLRVGSMAILAAPVR